MILWSGDIKEPLCEKMNLLSFQNKGVWVYSSDDLANSMLFYLILLYLKVQIVLNISGWFGAWNLYDNITFDYLTKLTFEDNRVAART